MVMANLLPVVFVASVLPLEIVMTLLLLSGERGLIKAMAFAAGAMGVRTIQSILFGCVFVIAGEAGGEYASHPIASILLLMAGIIMLINVVRTWRKKGDPDAPPPKWMTSLSAASALTTFGIGGLSMVISIKQWIFTLSAIAVINEVQLSRLGRILMYLFFVVAAYSLVLAPIITSVFAPMQAAKLLEITQVWLGRHNRRITMVASLILGVWFMWKGTTDLLAHGGTHGSPTTTAMGLPIHGTLWIHFNDLAFVWLS